MTNDNLLLLKTDYDMSKKEFSKRLKAIEIFDRQMDEAMIVTNKDLETEFTV